MGFLKSIKKKVSSIGSSVKSAVSTVGSKVSSTVDSIGSKIQSGAVVAGTNIKNSFSADSLKSFISGVAQGGLVNGIVSAAATTTQKSMEELDKSGEFNQKYAYKQYGFPSKEEFELACSYGYTDYSDWLAVKDMLGSDIAISEIAPVESVASAEVDGVGNITIKNEDVGTSTSDVSSSKFNVLPIVAGIAIAKTVGIF